MKITKIKVENYRLLKNFCIDLEDDLSLVVGKNNCGKTSLLSILDKFLNSHSFTFDDFNLSFSDELYEIIESEVPEGYKARGITLKIFIDYDKEDNLANISKLMMDLNPDNNTIILLFEYVLTVEDLNVLKKDFDKFKKEKNIDLQSFLKNNYHKYFKLFKKTVDYSDDEKFIDLDKEKISLDNVVNYKYIKANRDVSNKDSDKSLSSLSSSIYERIEANEEHQTKIDKFKDELRKTDVSLNSIYNGKKGEDGIFKSVIDKVRKFGGIRPDDTKISITSTLQDKDLLKGNTTVLYNHGGHELPENYNGLGYMNLINIIFEIEIKINEFRKKKDENPADINLLFIEEPEAHTHPQMQYIFIKNIKDLLKDGIDTSHKLQYIVSTHSSHIVSESDFDDIKYLKMVNNSIIARNLKSLEKEYEREGEIQNYKFLKQYLTLHRAELFFADKAIFIEGDTERILLPAMMEKIDRAGASEAGDQEPPLLSQNISIIETGNYSHIFEKFIDFIGVKSLIVTDIDSAKDDRNKCKMSDTNAKITTNSSLEFFYGSNDLGFFKNKTITEMILKKDISTKKWAKEETGVLLCIYQNNEINSEGIEYHARSFEDSFFHINRQFVIDNKESFRSLTNISYFDDISKDPYDLAEKCIVKKPPFAMEILLNSKTDEATGKYFSNWKIPDYIKQGLLWLKKD